MTKAVDILLGVVLLVWVSSIIILAIVPPKSNKDLCRENVIVSAGYRACWNDVACVMSGDEAAEMFSSEKNSLIYCERLLAERVLDQFLNE